MKTVSFWYILLPRKGNNVDLQGFSNVVPNTDNIPQISPNIAKVLHKQHSYTVVWDWWLLHLSNMCNKNLVFYKLDHLKSPYSVN